MVKKYWFLIRNFGLISLRNLGIALVMAIPNQIMCHQCGQIAPPDARFCAKCGSAVHPYFPGPLANQLPPVLTAKGPKTEQRDLLNRKMLMRIAGAVAGFVLLVIVFSAIA